MTGRQLVAVLALTGALTACRLDGSLEAYCERTGACACADGDCCTVEGGECSDAWGCCPGLTCEGQRCALKDPPVLVFSPDAVDLGRTTPVGGTGAPVTLLLRNTGRGPTPRPLAFSIVPSSDGVEVDFQQCEAAVLAAGEACEVTVAARPVAFGSYAVSVVAEAGQYEAVARVTFTAGSTVRVTLDGGGVATVTSEPPGILCPPDCTAVFNDGEQIALSGVSPAGSEFIGLHGGPCDGGTSCTFHLDGGTNVEARVDPWLRLEVIHEDRYADDRLTVAGTACKGTCGMAVAGPQTVVASAAADQGLESWTGACGDAGLTSTCTLDVQGPTTVGAEFSRANRVRLSPWIPSSQLGPDFIASADAACGAGYRAWLFSEAPGASLSERFGSARGWIGAYRPFADTLVSLQQGQVFYPIDRLSTATVVATGGLGTGPAEDCAGWTSPSATFAGGPPNAGGTSWARAYGVTPVCNPGFRVYCFGVTKHVLVTPRSDSERLAFLSSPWVPGGGVGAADLHCTKEAAAHGLAGKYLAALQTPTSAPSNRVSGGHRRLDHTGVGEGALNQLADGGYLPTSGDVFSETMAWTGDTGSHCDYWTSTSGTGRVGRPEYGSPELWSVNYLAPCDTAQRLYCLQE